MAAVQRDPLVDGALEMFDLEPDTKGLPQRQSPTSEFDPLVDGALEMFDLEQEPEPIYPQPESEGAAVPQPIGGSIAPEEVAASGRQPSIADQALMGLVNEDPRYIVSYMKEQGFDASIDPYTGEAVYKPSKDAPPRPALEGITPYWPDFVEWLAASAATTGRAIGLAGAPTTGGAAIGAAAALGGAATGGVETAKQVAGRAVGIRPEMDPGKIAEKTAMGAGLSGLGEGAGQAIGRATRGLKKAMMAEQKGVPKMVDTPEQIKEAAKTLGVEPTSGMLTSNQAIRNIEATLDKMSFTAGGAKDRAKAADVRVAIQDAADALLSRATLRTPAEVGDNVKQQILQDVQAKLAPAEKIYKEVQQKIGQVKINRDIQKETFAQLREKARLKVGPKIRNLINDVEEAVNQARTVDDLKEVRTSVARTIDPQANPDLKYFHQVVYDALTKMRADSFEQGVRDVKGRYLPKDYGQILNELKKADKIWKDTSKEVQDALLKRGKRARFGPEALTEMTLEGVESEGMGKFLPGRDIAKVRAMEKLSPKATEQLAEQEIRNLADTVTSVGEGMQAKKNFGRLVSELKKKSPEVLKVIFKKHELEKIKAAEILHRNAPFNPNPSLTSVNEDRQRAFTRGFIRNLNSMGLSQLKNFIQSENPMVTPTGRQFIKDAAKAGLIVTGSGLRKILREEENATDKRNKR
jgi:hypothetical protein